MKGTVMPVPRKKSPNLVTVDDIGKNRDTDLCAGSTLQIHEERLRAILREELEPFLEELLQIRQLLGDLAKSS